VTCPQRTYGQRSDDPVDRQTLRSLKADHRRFGQRTKASVKRAGMIPGQRQLSLQLTHQPRPVPAGVSGAWTQQPSTSRLPKGPVMPPRAFDRMMV
jgi:hypothetical protein